MARPITLFTGQWADLPFEEVARLASEWGYEGLEIACWGDHLDVRQGGRGRELCPEPAGHPGEVQPEGLDDLQPSAGAGGLRRPDRPAAPGDPARAHLGRRRSAEGVRQRAAEEMATTARAARALGVDVVVGFTGSSIWKTVAMFPPVPQSMVDAGLQRLRGSVEPDPRCVRRGGCAVRARGAPVGDRVRLLVDDRDAGGDRAPRGVRAELGSVALRLAGPRPGRLPVGLQGPDLPRRLQGREAPGRQRPQRPDGLPPGLGRPASRLGLRVHRPRRCPVGSLLPDAQHDRLHRPDLRRMGRRRHGPPGRRRRSPQLRQVASPSTRPQPPSTQPSLPNPARRRTPADPWPRGLGSAGRRNGRRFRTP